METTNRINGDNLYGTVNYTVKDGDFKQMSYVNIENGKGVICGSAQAEYVFTGSDVSSFTPTGRRETRNLHKEQVPTEEYIVKFNDGKVAHMDLYTVSLSAFILILGL